MRGKNSKKQAISCNRQAIWNELAVGYLKKQGAPDSEIAGKTEKLKVHDKPGPHTIEMFRRLGAGKIKVQFLACVNPGQSLPYAWPYRQAMAGTQKGSTWPLTVILEAFPTSSTVVSDVVLGASSWYEKEFVFGNLERRYQVVKQVINPFGNTMSEHSIIAIIMGRLEEKGVVPEGPSRSSGRQNTTAGCSSSTIP